MRDWIGSARVWIDPSGKVYNALNEEGHLALAEKLMKEQLVPYRVVPENKSSLEYFGVDWDYSTLLANGYIRISFNNIQGRPLDIIKHWETISELYEKSLKRGYRDSEVTIETVDDDGKHIGTRHITLKEAQLIPDIVSEMYAKSKGYGSGGFSAELQQFRRRPAKVRPVRVRAHRRQKHD